HELPAVKQNRAPDGSLGPHFRLALERGAMLLGERPAPKMAPGGYALPHCSGRLGCAFYSVLRGGRVFRLDPASGNGLQHEVISRGALDLVLGGIARNPQRAAQLFVRDHDTGALFEWSTSDDRGDVGSAVCPELEAVWPEAERLGWTRQEIFGAAFWPIEARGLAALL